MDAATLDAAVWGALEQVLANPALVLAKLQAATAEDTAAVEVEALDKQVADCRKKMDNLTTAIANATSAAAIDALSKGLDALAAEQALLLEKRSHAFWRSMVHHAALQRAGSLIEWCQHERDRHATLSYAEKRAALERAGVQVELYRDRPWEGRWELLLRPAGVSLQAMQKGADIAEALSRNAAPQAQPGVTVATTASSTPPPAARCR